MQLFRQIYQYANFCGNTPAQRINPHMQQHPEHIAGLTDFYQHKRDAFNLVQQSRAGFTSCQGTYFQTVDYTEIHLDLNDVEMCYFLAEEKGIVAIPLSVFYQHPPKDLYELRFVLLKQNKPYNVPCSYWMLVN